MIGAHAKEFLIKVKESFVYNGCMTIVKQTHLDIQVKRIKQLSAKHIANAIIDCLSVVGDDDLSTRVSCNAFQRCILKHLVGESPHSP